MSWHDKVHEEMSWFEELRAKKIARGDICGGCGEWPEYCCCKNCNCCNASISGWCLAVTHNVSYCKPECCAKIEGSDGRESDWHVDS